ncbi:MAG TPA: efflux transporter outer membrane subunit [Stellaceae bacterium]|nr:efflux transporter outer membrane subunit [Stellaceae bacterium]
MWRIVVPALGLALVACTVGPDYVKPPAPTPVAFKELDGWKPATPREAASDQDWWAIYHDPVLDNLESQIDISNQTLKASEAAYREATALVDEARSQAFPTAAAAASAQRSSLSAASGRGGESERIIENQFTVAPSVTWAPDIWGRIRRTVESNVANAQASAADLAAARLLAEATLATDYLELRVLDEERTVLDNSVAAFQKSLDITKNQYTAGVAAQTDVITAETELENTQAQLINVGVQRAVFEHAIAVLTGKPPAELTITPVKMSREIPVVPPGLPSTLLERRPDIAAAERTMQAGNALIGVAIAAYYPDIELTASANFTSTMLQNLLSLSNSAWSIAASANETVFDAGLRSAQVAAARATYDEDVANYRETVLTAFQQVEDELSTLRILEQQASVQDRALQSARLAVQLNLNQYQAGTVSYTNVVVAQTTALNDELTVLGILENRLVASVALVQAVGGGWNTSKLPPATKITADP